MKPNSTETTPKKYTVQVSAAITGNNLIKQAPLNPNHTHFILVDNARLNRFGGEIDFRSNLEKAIADYNAFEADEKINIVVLVVSE